MSELSLAQQMAHETDEFKVFQACVDQCMTIAETERTMDEWKTIRARIENPPFNHGAINHF